MQLLEQSKFIGNFFDSFYEIWKNESITRRIGFYFGQVRAHTAACADIASQCFTTGEYSRLIIDLSIKAKQRGISTVRYPSLSKSGYCGADNLNNYVVAPTGLIFKCWAEIASDEKESIGNVFEKEQKPFQIMNAARYLNWDPFSNQNCQTCNIFPICNGGCIYNGLKSSENNECNSWKYNLKDMLMLNYIEINKKNKGG